MKTIPNICLAILLGALVVTQTNCSNESTAESSASAAVNADPMLNKGIGPVSSVTLGALDITLAGKGKETFALKCTACHNTPDIDSKKIGPSLKSVTKRRAPEWIMNQILNPTEMAQKDPIAQQLLATYIAQMANQNLTQEEARNVLEYFRQNDSNN